MRSRHKNNFPRGAHEVKAALIRKYGTIAAYIRESGHRPGTVYAAIRNRRDGPISRAIKAEALR